MANVHNSTHSLQDLADNARIVKHIREHRKLATYEALTILGRKPGLRRTDNFVNL